MKLNELRIRGSAFTFGAVVSEDDHMYFRALISYLRDLYGPEHDLPESFEFRPVEDSKEDTILLYSDDKFNQLDEYGVSNGYLSKLNGKFSFTEKAIKVFEKVIEADKRLVKENFSYCPCHRFC